MSDRRILVVDDEHMIRDMLDKAFTREGYVVTTAESAEAALEILKETPFRVMFLDLNLPGMNGVELCRRIRQQRPMAIAYAITGYARMFEVFDCRDAGFEDYFTKPIDLKTLYAAAHDAFSKLDRWERTVTGAADQKAS